MAEVLELGEVPFYWRVKDTVDAKPQHIPSRLPFAFTYDESLSLIIQERNPLVLDWLERVYTENANVGYLQEGHALAQSYGGEFLDFFVEASSLLPKAPRSAADIGCGGVYLLQRVKEMGLDVAGIDPSPVTAEAGRIAGIPIISDFYPSAKLSRKFDVLFHYDVLEHVEDPVAFLAAHKTNLSEGGALIFAVPDCSHHIRSGDLSMMLHEHLNYFDHESLENVVRAAGYEPRLLRAAAHGGVLLCFATPTNTVPARPNGGGSKFSRFKTKAQLSQKRFADLLAAVPQNESVGIYVPLRAFCYLSAATDEKIRFFDDDPGLRGRYFDGFEIKIESFDDLLNDPPAHVLACSFAFGERIIERIKNTDGLSALHVHKWVDLF